MKDLFIVMVFSLFTVMTNLELQAQAQDGLPNFVSIATPWDYTSRVKNKEIRGNPFIFEDWDTKGIVYAEGEKFEGDKLNYNIYEDKIGALNENDSVFFYETQYIDSVMIDNIRLHKLDGKFYVVLQTGTKASLFKKYDTRIVEGMVNHMDGTQQKSRLVIMNDYYVLAQGSLQKFKPSKNSLEEVFGQQAKEMKKMIKSEKLNYKKEEDLIHIFESFNSL